MCRSVWATSILYTCMHVLICHVVCLTQIYCPNVPGSEPMSIFCCFTPLVLVHHGHVMWLYICIILDKL